MVALLIFVALTLVAVCWLLVKAESLQRRQPETPEPRSRPDDDRPRWHRHTVSIGPGAPIEHASANLRRLRRGVASARGRSAVRQLGEIRAYDQVLTDIASMLRVEHDLPKRRGLDRDIERLRVEAELERVGLVLAPTPVRQTS